MSLWRHRLPVRAAASALAGATCGAAASVAVRLVAELLFSAPIALAPTGVAVGLTALGAAIGAGVWAAREARTLRAAVGVADAALAGRSLLPVSASGSESAVVAHAVRALVERAERSSRELSQRQAYAAVGDFAAELVRELAPSVASSRTALRQLDGQLHADSPFLIPLGRAQRELHRLSNTLQDTLRLARSGRLTARRLDLWQPLRAALRTVTVDAKSRGVWLEPPTYGRAALWVEGDQDAIEQLFVNLLLNAVQASDSGAIIDVRVELGADAVVTITDHGCGIPAGALDRVFEPFYTTRPERAGLGLAIAWRTAAAHGGRLSIESALGRGTTVHVAIPRAQAEGEFLLEKGVP